MTQRENNNFQYDVFLSHNSMDKPIIKKLAIQLKETGVEPFLDNWHLIPGEPWQEKLEQALESSATCAVFLGSNGLGPWENEEMRVALDRRVHDNSFRVIPVILPGDTLNATPTLPPFLRRLTYVDFRAGLDDPEAFGRLLIGIQGVPKESASQDIESNKDMPMFIWLSIKLARGNSEERKETASQLGRLKTPMAISILEQRWSQEPDATVRHWIALALGEIGGEQAIKALHRIKSNESDRFAQLGLNKGLQKAVR